LTNISGAVLPLTASPPRLAGFTADREFMALVAPCHPAPKVI
jgi:hypothetical protein